MKKDLKTYTEVCECGGVSPVVYVDKRSGEVTLKCNKCGDTFEAEEGIWQKPQTRKS